MLLKEMFVHFIDSSVILEAPGLQLTGGRLLFSINNIFNSVCSTHKTIVWQDSGCIPGSKVKGAVCIAVQIHLFILFFQKARKNGSHKNADHIYFVSA